jgi:hypothetical protein
LEVLFEGLFGHLLPRHPDGKRLQPGLHLVDYHHRRILLHARSFVHHETDLPFAVGAHLGQLLKHGHVAGLLPQRGGGQRLGLPPPEVQRNPQFLNDVRLCVARAAVFCHLYHVEGVDVVPLCHP